VLTLFFALVVISGCKKNAAPAPPPPEVLVITLTPKDVPVTREWIGQIEGMVNAQIRAQVTGYLMEQGYAEGSAVQKGSMLFQIDPRPFQAALDEVKSKLIQDQAQLTRTQWDVKQFEPLAKENAISQQEYNNAVAANLAAEAQIKADQASVEHAQLNIEFCRVTSPINGVAGTAQAQIGDLVGPNGPILTTVSTINPIRVFFTASEQAYLAYRRQYTNDTARTLHEKELQFQLILADGSTYPYEGKFLFAGREVNPATGTIQLAALFPNPDYTLRPGQFARIRAVVQFRKDAILVPQRAVIEFQGSYQVAVVNEQNKVHLQTVKAGERIGSDWVIESGLQAGERVVVEGTQKAKEGVTISPKPYVETAAAK